MSELVKALVKARQKFLPIAKDRLNPHYKSRYATLDSVLAAVQPGLDAGGLAIVQTIEMIDSSLVLVTELIHESGESKKSVYPLPANLDPQKFGSALTYGRRYSVCAILSVTADEDEDGTIASNASKSKLNGTRQALMKKTAEQFHHLGWSSDVCIGYLQETFKVAKRDFLSDEQLQDLIGRLQKLEEEITDYRPDPRS